MKTTLNLLAVALLACGAWRLWPKTIDVTAARQQTELRGYWRMHREADFLTFRYSHKHGTYRLGRHSWIKF